MPVVRLMVTGGSGYVGRHLTRRALARGWDVAADRVEVTDPGEVRAAVRGLRPHAVVHAATAQAGAGDEQLHAVNVVGARVVATTCAEAGVRLVHLSSDTVFDGTRAPYADDAPVGTAYPYGRSKALGEGAVATAHPGAAIVRSAFVFGLDEMDRSTAAFVERLAAGGRVALWANALRQPVWVETLVEVVCGLCGDWRDLHGAVNTAGREVWSRAGLGRLLLAWWGTPGLDRIDDAWAGAGAPLDLRVRCDRLDGLGVHRPGPGEVLARAARGRPRPPD